VKKMALWQRVLIGSSSSMFLVALFGFDLRNVTNPGLGDRAIASSDTSDVNKSIMRNLSGQWQQVGGNGSSQVIFTIDGKLCLISPRYGATVFNYEITNAATQPIQLSLSAIGVGGSVMSEIEFISDTQIQISGGGFTETYQKVSEGTDFPADAYYGEREPSQNEMKEAEAQSYVGSINRGQQAFFLENDRFSDSLRALELGIQDSSFYQYKMQLVDSERVLVTATAMEEGLRSFSGIVYLERIPLDGAREGMNFQTHTNICATEVPSRIPPACSPS
jgi:hypothetical protein